MKREERGIEKYHKKRREIKIKRKEINGRKVKIR